jgi:hypothetical protein
MENDNSRLNWQTFLSSKTPQMAPESQTKLHKFRDFSSNFAKKTLNFNCDFLKEGKRYLIFPVDFLKAQTIVFHSGCNHFPSISLLLGVKSLQNNEAEGH